MLRILNCILTNPMITSKLSRFALVVLLVAGSLSAQGAGSNLPEFVNECEAEGFAGLVSFIYQILKGGFGALIMIVSGVGAILAAAFGQYRAALSALVVALGVFVLQIFTAAFFGQEMFDACGGG
ncbi:MAG: hypothetical protein NZO16_00695 [Deltaproteobacteria bacterium]|nr:hypothetical protein [Deltaproteobacteria bacterium]